MHVQFGNKNIRCRLWRCGCCGVAVPSDIYVGVRANVDIVLQHAPILADIYPAWIS